MNSVASDSETSTGARMTTRARFLPTSSASRSTGKPNSRPRPCRSSARAFDPTVPRPAIDATRNSCIGPIPADDPWPSRNSSSSGPMTPLSVTAFKRGSRHDMRRSFSTMRAHDAGQPDARPRGPPRPPRPCRARRGRADARSRSTARQSPRRATPASALHARNRRSSPCPACTAARAPQANGDSTNTSRSSSVISSRRAAVPPRLSTRIGTRLSSTPRPIPAKSTRS